MAINPTTLLRHIKMMSGVPYKVIPFSDEDIMSIVFEETLYTFSAYYPYFVEINVNGNTDMVPGTEGGVYYLHMSEQVGDELEILGVSKFLRQDGYYTTELYPVYRESDFLELYNANEMTGLTTVPDTYRFIEPNKIEIFPKSRTNWTFLAQLKCIHPRHLGTIPLGLREYFYKLATLDVKIALFHAMKNYAQLQTPYGSIDMKIEDYQDAIQEREQLLDKLREQFWKEANRKRIWFA